MENLDNINLIFCPELIFHYFCICIGSNMSHLFSDNSFSIKTIIKKNTFFSVNIFNVELIYLKYSYFISNNFEVAPLFNNILFLLEVFIILLILVPCLIVSTIAKRVFLLLIFFFRLFTYLNIHAYIITRIA